MKTLAVLSVVFVALVPAAFAQTEVEGFVGFYDPGSDLTQVDFDNGSAFGFRLGQSFLGVLGTEFGYTAATGLKDRLGTFDDTIHMLNGNFLVQLPVAGFVPFATLGFGGIVGQRDTTFRVRSAWTWNAGGGLKVRNIAGPLGLRFDVRYYNIPDGIELLALPPDLNKENFNILELSGGLLLTF
ncbi:MAG: outer membrane beta-barrel protein [Acidobacteriota bacterium]